MPQLDSCRLSSIHIQYLLYLHPHQRGFYMGNKIKAITKALHEKAGIKQEVYKNTREIFNELKATTEQVANKLRSDKSFAKEGISIELKEISEFEFHLKFGGDMLVFIMQTNIFAFPGYHPIYKSSYIKSDHKRSFFGQILLYNFIADSIKYRRKNDFGYLIERIFINIDKHFYVEGMRKLNFAYPDIARNQLTPELLEQFIEDAILISIETDLVMSSFEENFKLTIEQKEQNRVKKLGSKLGFQFTASNE